MAEAALPSGEAQVRGDCAPPFARVRAAFERSFANGEVGDARGFGLIYEVYDALR
jgi:hypothetical protein